MATNDLKRLQAENERLRKRILELSNTGAELRLIEQRFNAFFAYSPVGLALFNHKLEYLLINQIMADINGKPVKAHIGKSIEKMIPSHSGIDKKLITDVLRGEPMEFELNIQSKIQENTERNFFCNFFPLPGLSGKLEFIGAIVVESTLQKKIDNQLKESELRFHASFQNSIVGIVICSIDRKIIYSNPRWASMMGYRENEMLGKTIAEFTYPDDMEDSTNQLNNLSSGEIQEFRLEKRYIRKDGSIFWGQLHVSAIRNPDGSPKYTIAVVIDINDRVTTEIALKENEGKFRSFIEQSSEGILITDSSGIIVEWNFKLEELFRYSKKQMIGKKIGLIDNEVFKQLSKRYKRKNNHIKAPPLPLGRRVRSYSFIPEGNRSKCYLEVSEFPLQNENREYIAWIIRDITLQKRAEESIKRSERKLKELNASKDQLFTIIGHDLRNPFNAILGFTQLLKNNIRTLSLEKIEEYNQIIYQSAYQAYGLLENLLNWSLSQTGRINYMPETIRANDIVNETTALLSSQARNKRITFHIHVGDQLFIEADPKMIRLVLRNLLTNAIKFSYTGSAIRITGTPVDKMLEFRIIDSGIGIPKELQKKLFRLKGNWQIEGTENEKGSGLGLRLCYDFVKRQHGKISVNSKPGKGSEFIFAIPLASK